jgi:hypothetical protein
MHAAVATLQKTARQLQLSGELEQSAYSRIMNQLREVTEQLSASERRRAKQKAGPVNFTALLRGALASAPATADAHADGLAAAVPRDIWVVGPAHDLRDLLCSLIEYARAVGCDPIELRADIQPNGSAGPVCATELIIQSPDLPDFLRRKLWDAVRIRRGEVSVVSELARCRIGFTLPIERRIAAHD